jgi:hypothetical protein
MSITNIGPKISYSDVEGALDFIPTTLRLGGALTTEINPYNKITFASDIAKLMVPTPPVPVRDDQGNIIEDTDPDRNLLSGMFGSFNDAPNGFSEELQEFMLSAGIEYWYNNMFALRTGIFHEHQNKGFRQYMNLGVGIRFSKFGIDFAYLLATRKDHPLKDTLRFTLLLDLDSSKDATE